MLARMRYDISALGFFYRNFRPIPSLRSCDGDSLYSPCLLCDANGVERRIDAVAIRCRGVYPDKNRDPIACEKAAIIRRPVE